METKWVNDSVCLTYLGERAFENKQGEVLLGFRCHGNHNHFFLFHSIKRTYIVRS